MKKIKISVPTSLKDISVLQYKKLADLDTDNKDETWLIDAVAILCNLSIDEVKGMDYGSLTKIGKIVNNLNDVDKNHDELQTKLKYKGKNFGFHPNLSKLTVGEFADLESYCDKGFYKNLGYILSVLYRPIKFESGDFYTIENYKGDGDPKYWDDMKMNIVMGAVNFFLSIGVTLTKGLAKSLTEAQGKI